MKPSEFRHGMRVEFTCPADPSKPKLQGYLWDFDVLAGRTRVPGQVRLRPYITERPLAMDEYVRGKVHALANLTLNRDDPNYQYRPDRLFYGRTFRAVLGTSVWSMEGMTWEYLRPLHDAPNHETPKTRRSRKRLVRSFRTVFEEDV